MKSISKILIVITILLSTVNTFAQIKDAKSETVKIYGNCGMCKTTIEKAGNIKDVASVEWNKDTKMAVLSYDSKKTGQDEILKRIALAGYDSESFRAPDDVYEKLHGCCQYDRPLKTVPMDKEVAMNMNAGHGNHSHTEMVAPVNKDVAQNQTQLKPVFDNYFSVKDALIKTDAATVSAKATELVASIKTVNMTQLSAEEHIVWMKVMQDLTANAESISKSKDVSKQRETFTLLSKKMYELAKVSKQATPVYYQHCPMFNKGKGAYWLSKDSSIKNPYYGSKMLTCGSVTETIK